MSERLGLRDREIDWLRDNRSTNQEAAKLVDAYNRCCDTPSDPGARGIFAAMLEHARRADLFSATLKASDQ